MPNTFELIASSTVGAGGAASIDFTSIPQTFTDLVLKVSARGNYAGVGGAFFLEFNGLTTNLSSRVLEGSGSAVSSFTAASRIQNTGATNANNTANTFGNAEFYIPNYRGSTNKSVSVDGTGENNATENYSALTAGLWSNTSAITSIKLLINAASSIVQHSTAYLYGVKNA
jgi:hypothetical protein